MYYDYKLRTDAYRKLLRDTFYRHSAYIGCIAFILAWFYFLEQDTFSLHKQKIVVVLFFILIVGLYTAVRYYFAAKAFRMITTDLHLEFISVSGSKVEIQYTDISRIERTKENVLLIYTRGRPNKPVVAISDTITERLYLESILLQYMPIIEGGKVPIQLNPMYIALMIFVFFSILLLHFLTEVPVTVFTTGILALGLLIYSGIDSFRFSKQIKNTPGRVGIILLALIIVLRMALYMMEILFTSRNSL